MVAAQLKRDRSRSQEPDPCMTSMLAHERTLIALVVTEMKGNQTILQAPEGLPGKDKDPKSFTFDKSYWSAGSKDDPD